MHFYGNHKKNFTKKKKKKKKKNMKNYLKFVSLICDWAEFLQQKVTMLQKLNLENGLQK